MEETHVVEEGEEIPAIPKQSSKLGVPYSYKIRLKNSFTKSKVFLRRKQLIPSTQTFLPITK